MALKITNFDNIYVLIQDGDEEIYRGARDVECIIEAMGFYYGEDDIEYIDKKLEKAPTYMEKGVNISPKNNVESEEKELQVNIQNNRSSTGNTEDFPDDD